MKTATLSSVLLLVSSSLVAGLPQEPDTSLSIEPLPTVGEPSLTFTRSLSLTPQPSRTTSRIASTSSAVSESPAASSSAAPTQTEPTSSITTTPVLPSQSISAVLSSVSSAAASATGTPNAAHSQFGTGQTQGIAVLSVVAAVLTSMLFVI